jgi:hypothetical protein
MTTRQQVNLTLWRIVIRRTIRETADAAKLAFPIHLVRKQRKR